MKTVKQFILTITITMIGFFTMANSTYHSAMESALLEFKNAKSINEFQNTANTFQRISNSASNEWLPLYYHAHCYIIMSFMEKDNAQKDVYLDQAEKALKTILTTQPENSEVFTLQGYMYTGRLVVDPMTRGREFSIKSNESLKKALELNPTNPRALYLQLTNEIGTADFFGTDTQVYCERIEKLNQNWDAFNQSESLHPKWGKEQALSLKNNCKE